jgi:hypothetical protein
MSQPCTNDVDIDTLLQKPDRGGTPQNEKAAATGDTQPGESSSAIPAILDSFLFAVPTSWHGLCQQLKA